MKLTLRRLLLASVVGIGAAALLIVLNHTEAVAQIRAALTKNVDEPGRTPWNTRSQFLPNAGGCYATSDCFNYSDNPSSAVFDLRPVPAGKRWIVQSVTGGLNGGNGRVNQIELLSPRGGLVFDGLKWGYAGPYFPGTNFSSVMFSANLFATFEPGETPTVKVSATPSLVGYSVIVFNGYLIDATN